MTVPCAFPFKALFCNFCRKRSGLNFTCRSWDNLWASWGLLYVRPSFSRHCSRYCKSVSDHLRFAPRPVSDHRPPNPQFCQRLIVALTVCSWHSKISAIAGVFHPWAFRRKIWARSLVLCGTQVATRNSNNVRSSSFVKTIRMGAGVKKTASVQKIYLLHLTFYCSRLLKSITGHLVDRMIFCLYPQRLCQPLLHFSIAAKAMIWLS